MSTDDEEATPTEEDPSPPTDVSPEDVYDAIMQSLVDDGVTFDDDGNAVLPDLDASYGNVGRGHHEAIGVLLGADAEDAPADGGDAPADEGAAEGDGGEDQPLRSAIQAPVGKASTIASASGMYTASTIVAPWYCPCPAVRLGPASTSDLTRPGVR